MVLAAIIILFFSVCYALKGGQGGVLFPWWKRVRGKNKVTERLFDGKVISTILVFVFSLFFYADTISLNGGAYGVPEYSVNLIPAILFASAWLLAVSPSMGEEHGAIGRWGYAWGQYVDNPEFGRVYGVKKGLQRGVWIGACMALATGYIPYICFSILFVPCVFIGQQASKMILNREGWFFSEFLIGAVVFGVPTALMAG